MTGFDGDFRCAVWTRAHDVDPVGSAGSIDRFVLVEVPLPWPDDIGELDVLAGVELGPTTRVLAIVPELARPERLVTVWERVGVNRLVGTDLLVDHGEVRSVLERLSADEPLPGGVSAPAELLVCAHGRRDPCCGSFGTRLAAEVAGRWPGVRVRRCSHTGGHRFAPTAVTLPDGRLWAWLTTDVLDAVVSRTGDPATLALHDRGSSGVPMWAQPVERALLHRFGWRWLHERTDGMELGQLDVDTDQRGATVTAEAVDPLGQRWAIEARVVIERDMPTLVCGSPPEHASKTSPVLRLDRFVVSSSFG